VVWSDPERRSGSTARILDARLARMRSSLIELARGEGVAVLSADVESDERLARTGGSGKTDADGKAEKDAKGTAPDTAKEGRPGLSLILAPLLCDTRTLGYVLVERSFRLGVGVKQLNGGPFTRAHLEFAAAAAYPLAARLADIRRTQNVVEQYRQLKESVAERYEIVGESPQVKAVLSVVDRVARANSPALILGESGTGKELVAHALHALSPRAQGPFVVINCAALPENLVESELFGHARGAFTGAVQAREGCFEVASGGTIFLDEIGELPLASQVKLLRVLQERQIVRLGENRLRPIDVRVVAATNRDLSAEVGAGRFREDLYFRLNVVDIRVPPLREREGDLPLLCRHFLARFGSFELEPAAMDLLRHYRWPGNIRELRNTLERMAVLARPDARQPGREAIVLKPTDIPLDILREIELGIGSTARTAGAAAAAKDTPPPATRSAPAPSPPQQPEAFSIPGVMPLDELQVAYARWVLQQQKGNKSKTARLLGIQRSTLYAWTEWENGTAPNANKDEKSAPDSEDEQDAEVKEPRTK
jgi:transcriptional regulator with GAF, ATPase, and Fis domain